MDDLMKAIEGRRVETLPQNDYSKIKDAYLLSQSAKDNAKFEDDKLEWAYFYGVEMAFKSVLEMLYRLPIADREEEIREALTEMKDA